MKGQILDFSVQNNTGIISGDDQNRYQFSGSDWKGQTVPARGQFVDFETSGMGYATDIYLVAVPNALGTQYVQKSRIVAALLAFFLGGFGIHKFYLGRIGWGIVYLLFCWTFIPSIVAFIEFIIYLCTSDEDFARKYG
ncbi:MULTISPECIES: TM2 domain-containing protein [Acinetobacter]|uniref:TM2 domain-containing protein n=1 Tax=Acinetobacter TaxID=469 RepID=UPI00201B7D74|nr:MULTISPECIES: TM2 domain-containing protein [Acinetobacter]MCL6239409.1 TM2 domain-containing protein [Acinetobacter amyesii]